MRTMLSWVCGLTLATNVYALTGLEAYYQGDFKQAAALLKAKPNLTASEEYYLGRMYLYGYGLLRSNALANQSFKRAAEKGSVPAQLLLGKIELLQNNNPTQALIWFKKAAKGNNVSAQLYCAGAYLFGVGTTKNSDLARDYCIAAAKNHNPIAQQSLAADFLNSKQTSTRKIGLTWLTKSVEAGDPEAEMMLADLYLKGDLVIKNPEQTGELLEEATAQDYIPSYYKMGRFLLEQGDLKSAQNWYQKAAERNYTLAQIALAEFYLDTKNPYFSAQKGFSWMEKAARNGSVSAQHAVAQMLQKGEGTSVNATLAAEWEQKAQQPQEVSAAKAQEQLAEWLTRGKTSRLVDTEYQLPGIYSVWQDQNALRENIYNQAPLLDKVKPQDIYQEKFKMVLPNTIPINNYYDAMMQIQSKPAAGKWVFPSYVIKRNTSVDRAQYEVQRGGYDYLNDLATTDAVNYSHVFKELLNQAILGDSTAQFDVAQMYQKGLGVTQSNTDALKFYLQAAAQNDLPAEYQLGLIYLQGLGVEPDYKIGMDWLIDAAFKGNAYAQYTLARIYELGYRDANGRQVIAPDSEQSLAMYQLSAANYYGPAQYRLADIIVRQPPKDKSPEGLQARYRQLKSLLQGAVDSGVEEAKLPLAFYNASDADETKQAQAFADAQHAAKDLHSADAAFLLGLMYDRGIATEADPKRAIYWYEQAETNPMSAFILGTYTAAGIGVSQNFEKATDYLQYAASKRFPLANFNLAVLKRNQNQEFLSYLNKASAFDLNLAGMALADYYMLHQGALDQLHQARAIYEQLANQGLASAQIKLGYIYEQGLGVTTDYNQASIWYKMAADHKRDQAQFLLGRLYQFGWIGNSPNNAIAKEWYAKIKSRYAPAAVAYGFIDEIENDDYSHAFNEYQQAADLGDPIAQYNLALIYEKGKNQAVDIDKAKALFKEAGKNDVIKAMVSIGNIYVMEQEVNKALSWLNKAVAQQDEDALYEMGWLAEKGLIETASTKKALQYYQKAAAQGQTNALMALAHLYQSAKEGYKDMAKSILYYKQLAAQNYPEAQYQLAKFCLANLLENCSKQDAQTWLMQAEQNGYRDAGQLLRLLASQSQTNVSYVESIPMSKIENNFDEVSV